MPTGKRIEAVENIPDPAEATAEDIAQKINELLEALRRSQLMDR